MNVTHADSLIGKVVRYEDGTQILLVSGGVGKGATWAFKRTDNSQEWIELPMMDALPYVMDLLKQMVE